jgi:hypothetical protein
MKNPEDDVHLSDGHGFMTQAGLYKSHLKVAKTWKEVCCMFHYKMMADIGTENYMS